jgi:hypothetical protein
MGYISARRLLDLAKADKRAHQCSCHCQQINQRAGYPTKSFVYGTPTVINFNGRRCVSSTPICYGNTYEELVVDAVAKARELTECEVSDEDIYLPNELHLWDEYGSDKPKYHCSVTVKVVLPHVA